MNSVTKGTEMHRYVLLPQDNLRVDCEGVLFHPLLDNGYTAQLLGSGYRPHNLVTRNDTPLDPEGELPLKHKEEFAGLIINFAIS